MRVPARTTLRCGQTLGWDRQWAYPPGRWSARRRSTRWPGRWPDRGCRTRCSSTSPGRRSPTAPSADAPARAEALRRTLLTPVVNATGVLLHTNLGRAPLAHHQAARAQSLELDLATGERGSRQRAVGGLLARLCGAEDAIVVNNNAAAVLLVLAALAAGRAVPVSRGESVEIGGGFRVPEVMEQSGARLVDVGTTNRTRLADYRRAVDARRRRPRAQGAPEQLPRRRLRRGHVGGRAGRRSARPSSSTSAAAWSTPRARGGRGRTRRRGWPASRPPCRPSPPAPRSSRSAATSCSAARRPGSSPGAPTSSPAAPPTRWPGRCGPAGSCSARCRTSRSPTCGATSWRRSRSGGWPPRRSPTSRARAEAIAAATGDDAPIDDRGAARRRVGARGDDPVGRCAPRRRPPRRAAGPRPAGDRPGPRRRHRRSTCAPSSRPTTPCVVEALRRCG